MMPPMRPPHSNPRAPKNRPEHTWRIQPDYWDAEREAVELFDRIGGETPTGVLPIDDFYTVKKHFPIREDQLGASRSCSSRTSGGARASVCITGTPRRLNETEVDRREEMEPSE